MNILCLDNCILINNSILVIGDIHVGYEEHIISGGLLPRIQMREILGKLEEVFVKLDEKCVEVKKIVLLGDLKHGFEGISDSEWSETIQLIDYLESKVKKGKNKIVLIKGNHDNFLGPIAKKRGIVLKKFYKIEDGKICFLHGHRLFKQCLNSEVLVMGHLHPAVVIRDKYKKEKFKCFLCGNWKGKKVYILPSFSGISFGYDLGGLNYQKNDSGFCIVDVKTLMSFDVLIYSNKEGKVLNFGKVRELIGDGFLNLKIKEI